MCFLIRTTDETCLIWQVLLYKGTTPSMRKTAVADDETGHTYRLNFPISWEEMHRDSRALAYRVATTDTFDRMICVTRGGLVPGAIVARELNIRNVDTISIMTYHGKIRSPAKILKDANPLRDGEKTLVVDDLVDTGRTAETVRAALPGAHFATVYAKPLGRPLVDTFITEVSQDTWITFPWDRENSD